MSKLLSASVLIGLNSCGRRIQPNTTSSLISNADSIVRLALVQNQSYFSTSSIVNHQNIANLNGYQNSILSETFLAGPQAKTIISRRSIYTDDALGIKKLDALKVSKADLYQSGKERYIERLAKYVYENETQSIFKDDLINLIALADEEQHLDLVENLAILLQKQQDPAQPDSWGSAVMRLYFKMNQLERALKNIKDFDRFGEFFNQRTSYQILLTMLYNAQRYQDVVDIYEVSRSKLIVKESDKERGIRSSRQLSVVAFAALAKMNTQESLKIAENLYSLDPENPYLRMRVVSLISNLALNQGQPSVALNLIFNSPGKNFVSLRTIKAKALIKLERYEDILFHLRESLADVRRDRQVILKEACDEISANLPNIEDEKVRHDLLSLIAELNQNNLVGDNSLESIIFKPIEERRTFVDTMSAEQDGEFRTYGQNRTGMRTNNLNRNGPRQNYQERDSYGSNYQQRDGGRRNYRDGDNFRHTNQGERTGFRVDKYTFE